MTNLDYLCVKAGQEIEEKGGKTNFQKALGVLREDGVYAMFLWLEDKDKKAKTQLVSLLNDNSIRKYLLQDTSKFTENFKEFCSKLAEVSQDIDKIFFLKKILERTLTYALYHAKIVEE